MKELKHNWETSPNGTTGTQMAAKMEAEAKHFDCKAQGFCADGSDLHPTNGNAALCIQFDAPPDFVGTGFIRLKCASAN